jgi:hypothetical protein
MPWTGSTPAELELQQQNQDNNFATQQGQLLAQKMTNLKEQQWRQMQDVLTKKYYGDYKALANSEDAGLLEQYLTNTNTNVPRDMAGLKEGVLTSNYIDHLNKDLYNSGLLTYDYFKEQKQVEPKQIKWEELPIPNDTFAGGYSSSGGELKTVDALWSAIKGRNVKTEQETIDLMKHLGGMSDEEAKNELRSFIKTADPSSSGTFDAAKFNQILNTSVSSNMPNEVRDYYAQRFQSKEPVAGGKRPSARVLLGEGPGAGGGARNLGSPAFFDEKGKQNGVDVNRIKAFWGNQSQSDKESIAALNGLKTQDGKSDVAAIDNLIASATNDNLSALQAIKLDPTKLYSNTSEEKKQTVIAENQRRKAEADAATAAQPKTIEVLSDEKHWQIANTPAAKSAIKNSKILTYLARNGNMKQITNMMDDLNSTMDSDPEGNIIEQTHARLINEDVRKDRQFDRQLQVAKAQVIKDLTTSEVQLRTLGLKEDALKLKALSQQLQGGVSKDKQDLATLRYLKLQQDLAKTPEADQYLRAMYSYLDEAFKGKSATSTAAYDKAIENFNRDIGSKRYAKGMKDYQDMQSGRGVDVLLQTGTNRPGNTSSSTRPDNTYGNNTNAPTDAPKGYPGEDALFGKQ